MNNRIVLLTQIYPEADPARLQELLGVLTRNINNPVFDNVGLFVEGGASDYSELWKNCKKVVVHPVKERVCYSNFYAFGASKFRNSYLVVANSDIYFDDSLALLRKVDISNRFFALTRKEELADGSIKEGFEMANPEQSQDAWICRSGVTFKKAQFCMGKIGCDNRIAHLAGSLYGLKPKNPSRTIRAIHRHVVPVRHYCWKDNERIKGPYLFVKPCTLEEALKNG